MAFAIKGQTKAAAAFKGNSGVYGLILFKFWVEVAYCSPGKTCYMVFAIKGLTKAAAAFKGNFGVYGLILFELCVEVVIAVSERLIFKGKSSALYIPRAMVWVLFLNRTTLPCRISTITVLINILMSD